MATVDRLEPEFSADGLLPRVQDEQFEWSRPNFGDAEDPVHAAATWVSDIATQMQFVWPAFANGVLVAPPLQHALDLLTRREVYGSSPEVDAELLLHPEAGTVAIAAKLPACDLCRQAGATSSARYDGPVSTKRDALWAFMCPAHYQERSTGRLGTGEGQYLMTSQEVPPQVWRALEAAREYWIRWSPIS